MHSVPKNAETHFKLVIVSDFFMNMEYNDETQKYGINNNKRK